VQNDAERKLKYKSLGAEIQRMWNLKCTIISVTTVATGIVTKSLWKNVESYTRKTDDSYTWNITQYGK
jgi:hypothetical protein